MSEEPRQSVPQLPGALHGAVPVVVASVLVTSLPASPCGAWTLVSWQRGAPNQRQTRRCGGRVFSPPGKGQPGWLDHTDVKGSLSASFPFRARTSPKESQSAVRGAVPCTPFCTHTQSLCAFSVHYQLSYVLTSFPLLSPSPSSPFLPLSIHLIIILSDQLSKHKVGPMLL